MSIQDDLLDLDRSLWSGGADEFREAVDDDCLVAFTQVAGVSSREEVASSVGGSQRWKNVEIEPKGVITPTVDVAILTYLASANRGVDETYRALVSSGYVKRSGAWKLMFHQHTPLEPGSVP
jgi:hypothetical protein